VCVILQLRLHRTDLGILCTASSPYTNPVITMCNRSIYVAYGTEGHGQIVSPHQNTMSSRPCVLNITACSRCRIQLNFTELSSGPFAAAERFVLDPFQCVRVVLN
jgi:hypothetical protein